MSFAPEFCSACALTALTAIGTFDSDSERRVAVMTISLLGPLSGATAAGAACVDAPAGGAAAGEVADGSVDCAAAIPGIANMQAEANQMLFMITPHRSLAARHRRINWSAKRTVRVMQLAVDVQVVFVARCCGVASPRRTDTAASALARSLPNGPRHGVA